MAAMQRSTTSSLPAPLRNRHAARGWRLAACSVLIALWPLASPAQVVRCTDGATGKVTYTNGECAQGASVREIEARKTPEQIRQERAQAADALADQRDRERRESQEQRERRAVERTAAPTRIPAAPDPAQSAECHQARRALQDVNASLGRGMYDEQARLDQAQRQADLACLSPSAYAESERARSNRSVAYPASPYYVPPIVVQRPPRPQPQPAPPITNCNVFRCYDGRGNTYPR